MSDTTGPDDGADATAEEAHAARNRRLLRWLIQATSLTALRGEAAAMARRASRRAMLTVAAGLLWLMAVGFAFGAFVVWLSGQVGTILACAIVAATFAAVALVLQLIAARMARKRPESRFKLHLRELADAVGNGAAEETAVGALAIIALAGFILGLRGKKH